MLNAMTPPQGPYQQPNKPPAGNPILLSQKRDSSSSSTVVTSSENSSSPVSSLASTSSSSSASTGSATSSPANLLPTPSTNQEAITSQQVSLTSERLRGGDELAQETSSSVKSEARDRQRQDSGPTGADQAERLSRAVSPAASKRSSAQPDFHQNSATSTSQDNSSKEQVESSPARVGDETGASSQAPSAELSTHPYQPAHSPAGHNPQYSHHQQQQLNHHHHHQQQQQQHNTSNHFKPTGHHSQPYRNSRFNNHISQQPQHSSHNSIKSATSSTNSGSFSAIRSRNQRGHNNSHRHKNNHHQSHHHNHYQNQNPQNHHHQNHHNHHHHLHQQQQQQQQQQSLLLTNGNLGNREMQQTLPVPYSTAAASASPEASLSGSELGARNTSSSAGPTAGGPPHYVEMHVFAGECVAFQLMDGQEQIITGPATMTMVSQQESPPVPIPVQVPPGHTIHQVADENGTLRHIIFSVMNCEDGDHMNSNVIDFPHETFRVDSLGELVSTSNNSIGMDGDGSTGDQQPSSASSKSTSSTYEKADPSHPYRQDTFNMGPGAAEGARAASNYKHPKSSYKHGNPRQLSAHLGREKSADFDEDRQQAFENGRRLVREQPNYDMTGHNINGSTMLPVASELAPEMDPSLMMNFGQMMAPGVDEQMYGYPNCACCCCYCDPNSEAAAAASVAVANNQPMSSPAQISTGSLIGQQDVIMMQQVEPHQPTPLHHDTRTLNSGSLRNGRAAPSANSMAYQNHHQANPMKNSALHQQPQVFINQPNVAPALFAKPASNINGTKAHTNKAPRGAHQAKQQHGQKSHQSNYERHHGNQNHQDSQPAYNSVASSTSAQPQQPSAAKEAAAHKSSAAKQLVVAQTNQQPGSQDNRLASEEKAPAASPSPTIGKSPSATTSPVRPPVVVVASPSPKRESQKLRDPTPTQLVKSEVQVPEPGPTSTNKKQNYPASDKSTTPRPVLTPNPVSAPIDIPAKQAPVDTNSSSKSSSPGRQPSQSRQSLYTARSAHHKNQESTPVSKQSHQNDEATKTASTTAAPNQQARSQPNSTIQRTASTTVTNKSDAIGDDTPSVISLVTRVTKQTAKVASADSATHQQLAHSKQKQIDTCKRGEDSAVASLQEPSRRGKQKKQHQNHNHNQSVKVVSILKHCRNKLATGTERVLHSLLSSYSDTKFAGLLLVIFTLFATLLAILIDHYIVAPVTE